MNVPFCGQPDFLGMPLGARAQPSYEVNVLFLRRNAELPGWGWNEGNAVARWDLPANAEQTNVHVFHREMLRIEETGEQLLSPHMGLQCLGRAATRPSPLPTKSPSL